MLVLVYKDVRVIQAKISNAKIGFGKAKARGWVELVKCDNGLQKVARKVRIFHFLSYSLLCIDSINSRAQASGNVFCVLVKR